MLKGATKLFLMHYLCVIIIFSIQEYQSLHCLLITLGYFFFILLCFMFFLSVMGFEFNVVFIEFQDLYNHCLYKHRSVICEFVLILKELFPFVRTQKLNYENLVLTHNSKKHTSKEVLSQLEKSFIQKNVEQSPNVIKK